MASSVSVIIPTLDEEKFIGDCLDSVKTNIDRCERHDFEVIIVDSYSSDDTLDIVRDHDLDCEIIFAEKGILNARHTGIEAADNDLIISLDADAVYRDTYFEEVLAPLEASSDTVLSYGPVYGMEEFNIDASFRLGLQIGLRPLRRHWVSGSNRAFRKDAYYKAGGYDLSRDSRSVFKVMYEEQYRFPLRMARHGTVTFAWDAKSKQSARTLKQLLLMGEKTGGQNWRFIAHYRLLKHLKLRLLSIFS